MWVALLAGVGCAGLANAATRTSLYAGSEYYSWREYDDSGARLLEESGPRYFIGVNGVRNVSPRWELGLDLRLYTGTVNYDGQTNSIPPIPAQTKTDYYGVNGEYRAVYFVDADETATSRWGLLLVAGFDAWRRDINDSAVASGYTERYLIGYGRLGLTFRQGTTWQVDGGIKYPLSTYELASLHTVGYDDVVLSPTPAASAFVSARYRVNQRWGITGYYDSYRFKKSPVETLSRGGYPVGTVWQPRIEQDRYGFSVSYQF